MGGMNMIYQPNRPPGPRDDNYATPQFRHIPARPAMDNSTINTALELSQRTRFGSSATTTKIHYYGIDLL